MAIDYAKYRRQLETMYNDRLTVQRPEKVKKPNGATEVVWSTIYQDVHCFISQKALGANNQTDTTNDIAYETKLFISPDTILKQGDKLTVTRGSVTREFTAGEPFPYPTHQEVSMERDVKA